MWRYQSPGFEALFMAALQRQQRCSQYCDTVLRAQDVSVPVHGCVLSTLSPLLSYELSAALPPPSGQSRLLEFQAFGPRTLLRLVDLLYSGEMAGEGEGAREEAMAAAAMLGIHGLEEVGRGEEAEGGAMRRESGAGPGTAGGGRGREEAATEAGSQTEPPRYGGVPTVGEGSGEREAEGRRRELGESDAGGGEEPAERDAHAGTPTPDGDFSYQPLCVGPGEPEHPHTPSTSALNPDLVTSHAASATPVAPHVAGALRGTGAPPPDPVTPVTLPDHIPYVSLSQLLLLPPDGHHDANQSTGPTPFYILPASLSPSLIPSAAALSEQVTEVLPTFPFDPPQAWEEPGGSPAPGDGDEFEQFEDNIPGFISYFLNQPQKEGQRGRRGTRRRAAGGGARRGRGEKRARRPRVDPGVRGEGRGVAAAVKPAEVVSQRGRLTSWGLRASRTGRGGGAAGRKVCLKTRELCRKRRRQTTRRGAAGVGEEGRGRAPRRAARRTARGRGQQQNALPQLSQEGFPLIKTQSPRERPLPFPALPRQLYRALTYDPQSHSPGPAHPPGPDPSPSPSPGPYLAPAPALLHTAPLPSPSQDGYPEPLDRLLEDIMMGLDIPPPDAAGAPPPRGDGDLPSEGSSERRAASPPGRQACVSDTCASAAEAPLAGRPEASGTGWSGRNAAVLPPQTEGELSDILESFLQSFELRFTGATPGEMEDGDAVCFSQSYTALRNCAGAQAQTSPAQPAAKPSREVEKRRRVTTRKTRKRMSGSQQPVRKLRVRLSQPGAVEASEFPRGKRPLPAGRPTWAPERVKVQTVPPTERSEEDVRAGGAQTAGGTERGRDGACRKLFTPSEVRSAPGRSGGGEETALSGRRRKREGRMTDVESETGRPKRRRAGAGPEPGQPVPDVPRPQASPGLELQIPGSADIKPPPGPARRGRGCPPSVLTPDGGRPPSVPTRGRGRPRAEHRAAGDGERRRAGRGHPTTPKKEPVSSEPRASPGLELQIPGSANTKPPPGPARRGRGRPPSDPTRGPRRPPSIPTRGRGRPPSIPTRGRGRLPSNPTPGVGPLPSVPTRGRGRPPSIPTRGRGRPRAGSRAAGDGERRRAWTPKKEPASSELHIPASGGSGKGGVVTLEVDEDVEVVQVTTAGELETVRVVRRPLGRRADGERRRGGTRGRARGRGRGGGGEDRKWTKLCPREPEQMEERRREEGVNGGSSSEEDIDVVATADSDDRASAVGEGDCQKRRVGERHPGIIKPPSPHPAPEVTEGSAGSCDEEEEDVDVLGSFCPSFFILGSDVTGGGSYYVPSVESLL